MPARPSWEGHLRLSLVTCPVTLWAATSEAETVRFNMINPKTNNRINMMTVDAGTREEVDRGDLVKGYAIAKNQYVLFTKEELESVKIESTKIIDIEKFVPRSSIDRLYWDTPYHLVPSGKTGVEAFAVIREAMRKQQMVAIGRLVLSQRERVCAIEVEEDALLMTTLRTEAEVRTLEEVSYPTLPKADPKMLDIAEKIVAQQAGDFDPADFRDRYEEALWAMIEKKKKGKPIKTAPAREAEDSNVVDLMAALRKSLRAGGGSRESPARQSPGARPKKAANTNRRRRRAA